MTNPAPYKVHTLPPSPNPHQPLYRVTGPNGYQQDFHFKNTAEANAKRHNRQHRRR